MYGVCCGGWGWGWGDCWGNEAPLSLAVMRREVERGWKLPWKVNCYLYLLRVAYYLCARYLVVGDTLTLHNMVVHQYLQMLAICCIPARPHHRP